jgi:hypothetical protein
MLPASQRRKQSKSAPKMAANPRRLLPPSI